MSNEQLAYVFEEGLLDAASRNADGSMTPEGLRRIELLRRRAKAAMERDMDPPMPLLYDSPDSPGSDTERSGEHGDPPTTGDAVNIDTPESSEDESDTGGGEDNGDGSDGPDAEVEQLNDDSLAELQRNGELAKIFKARLGSRYVLHLSK